MFWFVAGLGIGFLTGCLIRRGTNDQLNEQVSELLVANARLRSRNMAYAFERLYDQAESDRVMAEWVSRYDPTIETE